MADVKLEKDIKGILRGILTEIEMASEQGTAAIKILRDKNLVTGNELRILLKRSDAAGGRFDALRKQIDSL